MNFFGIGPLELLLILVLALVVLGPGRLADTGRKVGRMVGQLRKATADLPNLMEELLEGEDQAGKGPQGPVPPAAKAPPPVEHKGEGS